MINKTSDWIFKGLNRPIRVKGLSREMLTNKQFPVSVSKRQIVKAVGEVLDNIIAETHQKLQLCAVD